MTILFVMLGEVLIFLPSIANFRIQWLKGRIAQAEIAALAAEAAPDRILSPDLRTEILKGAGVLVVSLTRGETRKLMLRSEADHMIDASYDLRDVSWPTAVADAFAVMLEPDERVIGVIDKPPNMSGDMIEVALYEKPLRDAMIRFGLNILLLSVVLSVIVAGLVYLALNIVLIRPDEAAHPQHDGLRPEPGGPLAHHRALAPPRRDRPGRARAARHAVRARRHAAAEEPACGAGPRGGEGQPRPAQHAVLRPCDLRPPRHGGGPHGQALRAEAHHQPRPRHLVPHRDAEVRPRRGSRRRCASGCR